jgi:hypothetical protein
MNEDPEPGFSHDGEGAFYSGNPKPVECPGCRRIMSRREAVEQGACNDCIEMGVA